MTLVEARGVVAGYGPREVLRHVDLALARGERVALVGPNGSGKTTLLRVLAGMLAPRAGSALLDGSPVGTLPAAARAHRIAVVPQTFSTPFAFLASEVVALGRTPYVPLFGRLGPADRAAIERAMREAECLDLAERPFGELSAGERQRVVIAMALAQEGELLLLDEPTTHLDLAHQLRTLELVDRLAEERGMAVVAVLHDLALAARHFPRIAVLRDGRVVADGTPRAVVTPAVLREVFAVSAEVVWHDGTPAIVPDRVAATD